MAAALIVAQYVCSNCTKTYSTPPKTYVELSRAHSGGYYARDYGPVFSTPPGWSAIGVRSSITAADWHCDTCATAAKTARAAAEKSALAAVRGLTNKNWFDKIKF